MNATKQNPKAGGRGGEKRVQQNFLDITTAKIEFNDKPLPNSEAAESGVLEACIADSAKLDPVRAIISPTDFYIGGARAVFARMLELHGEDSPLTGVPFLIRLEASFEHHPDQSKFQDLFDNLRPITGTTALHFAQIVREMADRRRIIKLTYEANQAAFDPAFDLAEIIDELRNPLSHLSGGV